MTLDEIKDKALEILLKYEGRKDLAELDASADVLKMHYTELKCKYKRGDKVWLMDEDFCVCHAEVIGAIARSNGNASYRVRELTGRTVFFNSWIEENRVFSTREDLIAYYKALLDKYEHLR